jgi:hypothetical protein
MEPAMIAPPLVKTATEPELKSVGPESVEEEERKAAAEQQKKRAQEQDAAARKAEEERKAAEAEQKTPAQKAREEEERKVAAEQRKRAQEQEAAARKAEEEHNAAEAKRQAAEQKAREEEERKAASEREKREMEATSSKAEAAGLKIGNRVRILWKGEVIMAEVVRYELPGGKVVGKYPDGKLYYMGDSVAGTVSNVAAAAAAEKKAAAENKASEANRKASARKSALEGNPQEARAMQRALEQAAEVAGTQVSPLLYHSARCTVPSHRRAGFGRFDALSR